MKPIYLVVTPFFPTPDSFRGPYVLDQVKAIERTGKYRVVVFKPCNLWHREQPYEYDGIPVHYVPSFFTPSYIFNGFGGGLNGRNLLTQLQILGIPLKDIAVVHVHTASFACYATALKKANKHIKTVIQYHDPDPYQIRNGKWAQWRPNAMYRAKKLISQFKYIDLHLCISKKVEYNLTHFPIPHPEECYDSYKRALNVVKDIPSPQNLNTYVLYNGVDISSFHPIDGLKDSSIFKIGCVANFIDWKDQMTLIKAVEMLVKDVRYDNLRVSFVGSGITKQACQDYINQHNLQKYFIFEKEVHHSELVRYYNTLDIFVLPSYFEGFGCVFTEAAACGVPFMCCINQGCSEYISDQQMKIWTIAPFDHKSLSKHIEDFIAQPQMQIYEKKWNIDVLIGEYLYALNVAH